MATSTATTGAALRQPYNVAEGIDPITALMSADAIVSFITNEAENGFATLVSADKLTIGALDGASLLMKIAIAELTRREHPTPRHFTPAAAANTD